MASGENTPVFNSSKLSQPDATGGIYNSGPGYIKTRAGSYDPRSAVGFPSFVAPEVPQSSLIVMAAQEVIRTHAPETSVNLLPDDVAVPVAVQSSGINVTTALKKSSADPALLIIGGVILLAVFIKK